MKILIYDSESDALAEAATVIHCIAIKEYKKEGVVLYEPQDIDAALAVLHTADVLVCHNEKGHDLPLFEKLKGWKPKSHQLIVDTLVYSRMLYPKRPNPVGYYGNRPHSIEAWGYRVGRGKPEHEDWSQYTADMGHRCCEDTEINDLILTELEREADDIEMFYQNTRNVSVTPDTERRTAA